MAPIAPHHIGFIRKFKGAGPNQRKVYLRQAAEDEIRSLVECGLNICNGNVSLNPRQLRNLKKYKNPLKKFSLGKSSIKSKRRILIQKGGFLPALAAITLPVLANLVGNLI